MQQLVIRQKTGFKITQPNTPVIIRDQRGLLFYSTEYKAPNASEFNLPPGTYFVQQGTFRSMSQPIDYPLMRLPPHERERRIPKDFKIIWGRNPKKKCTINWGTRTITYDKSLADYSQAELDFIHSHELSHAHYETEKYCDLKACNYMIRKGYNPIQTAVSQIDSLSPNHAERKMFIVEQLKKTYGNRL